MNTKIVKISTSVVVLFGLLLGQMTLADSDPGIYVADTQTIYNWDLPVGGIDVPVMKFGLANLGAAPLQVTQIGIKNVGTSSNAEVLSAKFQRRNINNNPVLIGAAPFAGAGKTAVINGAPLFTIPVGETRDIEVLVSISGSASAGATGIFRLEAGLFSYNTATPPALVGGEFPSDGPTYTITATPVSVPMIQVLSPNGGEVFNKGTRYKLNWKYIALPKDAFIDRIELWKGGVFHSMIVDYTTVNRLDSYYWTPTVALPTGNNYRIRVYLAKGNPYTPTQIDIDTSDANFRIQ